MKVTIAFRDEELYRSVRLRAAVSDRQIRDVVEEALAAWLTAQEDIEDVIASRDALAEYEQAGGTDADAVFDRLVAEGRVAYDIEH